MSTQQKVLKIVQIIGFIAAPAINIGFSGDAYKDYQEQLLTNFILPAPYAFSIWGLIYIGMFAFTIWDAVKKVPETSDRTLVTKLLIVVAIADFAFAFAAKAQNYVWTSVLLLMHLVPLAFVNILLRERIAKEPVEVPFWVYPPISMLFAWVSAATVLTLAQLFYKWGWQPSYTWTEVYAILLIVVLTGLAGYLAWLRDYAYTSIVVWALVAVTVAQWSRTAVGLVALLGAVSSVLGFVYLYLVRHRSPWWIKPATENKDEFTTLS